MVKILLVILYLWNGEVKLEQTPFDSLERCLERGASRTEILAADPKFQGGFFAGCVPLQPKQDVYRQAERD